MRCAWPGGRSACSSATLWLTFTLRRFPYTRPWAEALLEFLLHVLGTVASGIAQAIPGLVFVVVIVVITRAVVRSLEIFLQRVESRPRDGRLAGRGYGAPTRRILTLLLWLFALAMAYPYLPGSGSEAFKGLSVLVGVMISIGASGIVGQAAGGLMITYTHTLRLGEYVRIGDTEGTVTDLGIFATRVRTGLGEEVTLPNAYVVANTIKNYSRMLTRRRAGSCSHTQVTIGYATPWRQVHAMLLLAAAAHPGPAAGAQGLSWCRRPCPTSMWSIVWSATPGRRRRSSARSCSMRLHANIQDVFNEYGVQIMSPHYMMDPAAAADRAQGAVVRAARARRQTAEATMTVPARQDLTRIVLAALCLIGLIGACFLILRPFLGATIWAAMIVVATWPLMLSVQTRLWNRRSLAVAVMTLGLLLVLVIPLLLVIVALVENGERLVGWAGVVVHREAAAASGVPGPRSVRGREGHRGLGGGRQRRASASSPSRIAPYAGSFAQWLAGKVGRSGADHRAVPAHGGHRCGHVCGRRERCEGRSCCSGSGLPASGARPRYAWRGAPSAALRWVWW